MVLPWKNVKWASVAGYPAGFLVGQSFGNGFWELFFIYAMLLPLKRFLLLLLIFFFQKSLFCRLGRAKKVRTRYLFLLSFRWSPCVGNGSQNWQRNVQASKSALNILTSRWKIYTAFSSTITKEGFPSLWHCVSPLKQNKYLGLPSWKSFFNGSMG